MPVASEYLKGIYSELDIVARNSISVSFISTFPRSFSFPASLFCRTKKGGEERKKSEGGKDIPR